MNLEKADIRTEIEIKINNKIKVVDFFIFQHYSKTQVNIYPVDFISSKLLLITEKFLRKTRDN